MAAYPTSSGYNASIRPVTRHEIDISDAGTVRVTNLSQDTVYRVTITHPLIVQADVDTLYAFYTANQYVSFELTHMGYDYTLFFEADFSVKNDSGTHFTLMITAVGTRVVTP